MTTATTDQFQVFDVRAETVSDPTAKLAYQLAAAYFADGNWDALLKAGNELVTLGAYREAERLFTRVVEGATSDEARACGRFNRSHCRLIRGGLAGYLADFESRWGVQWYRERYYRPFMDTIPAWWGQWIETLLVHGEQGIGDIIQSLRYDFPHARRVVYEVRPELVRLVQQLHPTWTVIERGVSLPPADAQIPTGSIAFASGYFRISPTRFHNMLHPYAAIPGRVGLCWAGSPGNPRAKDRDIPAELFAPLMRGDWACLVPGLRGTLGWTSQDVYAAEPPRAWVEKSDDFLDTARLVATCELVITCDTAIGHLAGALGVPCWLLVTKQPDPRWREHGETTDLYPAHRIFRQTTRGDWGEVLGRVQQELEARK